MIELAAAVWKTELRTAARRLLNEGLLRCSSTELETHFNAYLEIVAYRGRVNAFWQRCRDSRIPAESGEFRALMQQVGIPIESDMNAWRQRAGRFAGTIHRSEVDVGLAQHPPECPQRYWLNNDRRIPGRNWGDLLVIPGFDVPGRIRSFVFIGRQARVPEDVFVRHVGLKNDRGWTENGLALLPAALDPTAEGAGSVIVLDDPILALRLQDRHLRDNSRPLPICSRIASDRRGTNCWTALGGKNVVMWSPKSSVDLVTVARTAGARACSEDGVNDTASKFLSRLEPRVWFNRTLHRATDWAGALECRLRSITPDAGETELLSLGLTAEERLTITARGDLPVAKQHIENTAHRLGRTVEVNSKVVTESAEGWRHNGALISNARLRIDRIVRAGGNSYYRGAVVLRDRETSFCEPTKVLEKNTFQFMRDLLLARQVGVMQFDGRWSRFAIQIAMALEEPEIVTGAERCGWSPAGFVFADRLVTRDGSDPDGGHPLRDRLTPTTLCRDEPLSSADWAELTRRDDLRETFWAVAACVLADVLAPAYHLSTVAVGIEGESGLLGCRLAEWLGCAAYTVPSRYGATNDPPRSMREAECAHGWPVVFMGREKQNPGSFRTWMQSPGPRNCVVPVNWYESRVAATTGDWNRVQADVRADPGPLQGPAAKVAAAFLRRLLGRNLALPGTGPLALRVVDALAEWAAECGADAHCVWRSASLIEPAPTFAGRAAAVSEAFGQICARLRDEGGLSEVVPKNRKRRMPTVQNNGTEVWVPKATLYQALAEKGVMAIDDHTLSAALTETGVLLRQEDRLDHPQPGWVFANQWWLAQTEQYRGAEQTTIRMAR